MSKNKVISIVAVLVFIALVLVLIPFKKDSSNGSLSDIKFGPLDIVGVADCLPHKEKGGMHTMECAYGLLADDGKYYGLKNLSEDSLVSFETGKRYQVSGMLQQDEASIYDVVGSIDVTSFSVVE